MFQRPKLGPKLVITFITGLREMERLQAHNDFNSLADAYKIPPRSSWTQPTLVAPLFLISFLRVRAAASFADPMAVPLLTKKPVKKRVKKFKRTQSDRKICVKVSFLLYFSGNFNYLVMRCRIVMRYIIVCAGGLWFGRTNHLKCFWENSLLLCLISNVFDLFIM